MIAQVVPFPLREPREPLASPHLWGIVLAGSGPEGGTPRLRGRRSGQRRRPPGDGNAEGAVRSTVERAARLIAPERLVVVVTRPHALAAERDLRGLPGVQRLVQPVYRGSAPEIFLPVLRIAAEDPHATVVALPSGPLVDYEARFMSYVAKAALAVAVRPDLPVVIGAHPRTPHPGHGWIEPGEPVEGLEYCGIRTVKRFVPEPLPRRREERPDGGGLLSTLVLAARASTLIDLGRRHLPDVLETLEPLEEAFGRPEEPLLCEAVYECMPHANVARALLDGWQEFAVLPIPDLMWSDGRWPLVDALAS